MPTYYETLGAELSLFRAARMDALWRKGLPYCQIQWPEQRRAFQPGPEEDLVHDVLLKIFRRGELAYCSILEEEWILNWYGDSFGIKTKEGPSIQYEYEPALREAFHKFTDVLDPWTGDIDQVEFDPDHPENERALFKQLMNHYGGRFAHTATTQVYLEDILKNEDKPSFMGQRGDILLSAPNGASVLLEPGGDEHQALDQQQLDQQRDNAFARIGIPTLRPGNAEIGSQQLLETITHKLTEAGFDSFLQSEPLPEPIRMAANYLFLLPSLLVRVQVILLDLLFRQGLVRQEKITLGVVERDLECIELALVGLLDRIQRLCEVYKIELSLPQILIVAQRNPAYHNKAHQDLGVSVKTVANLQQVACDAVLDVGIKCNAMTSAFVHPSAPVVVVRQSFIHNHRHRFAYRSRPRAVQVPDKESLEGFVQDLFRKRAFREGQYEIISHALQQKHTIGLLPTSAGKSLCYQICALLTPGSALVIDPVLALMDDQTQTLREFHGISTVFALHSNANVNPADIPNILAENQIVFISPERLQRATFREALNLANVVDLFINYAVIDEAHCVSMWGHDFRPSYLCMRENLERLCRFQGRDPVMVALTGTASQLVLIDLKRELGIHEMDAVIRPKTFDRPELIFYLHHADPHDRPKVLKQLLQSLTTKLNVRDPIQEAWGLVFAHTIKDVWQLMGKFVADQLPPAGLAPNEVNAFFVAAAGNSVQTVLDQGDQLTTTYGLYTGGIPNGFQFPNHLWTSYKRNILQAFKRGKVRLLFGNTAVSVGIDNENLNYVVNYAMPQSMEAYYQQCGRAGRSGQPSHCFLIFSDTNPAGTQIWLDGGPRANTWDDISTVIYFHEGSFPGVDVDLRETMGVFRYLIRADRNGAVVNLPAATWRPNITHRDAENTERYLSYWLMMGVVDFYEVTGREQTAAYQCRLNPVVVDYLRAQPEQRRTQQETLQRHLVSSLHTYLSRYRPVSLKQIDEGVRNQAVPGVEVPAHSQKCAAYLIDFIYKQIAYQRRESIRTMVGFCNEEQRDPESLRRRIRAYFDFSEKFSQGLIDMGQSEPSFPPVQVLLNRIDDYNDAETLYWETRRLLDERFRMDWAAANLYTIAYRERGSCSQVFMSAFQRFISSIPDDLRPSPAPPRRDPSPPPSTPEPSKGFWGRLVSLWNTPATQGQKTTPPYQLPPPDFFTAFFLSLIRLDRVFGENISGHVIATLMGEMYMTEPSIVRSVLPHIPNNDHLQDHISFSILNLQLKELLDATRHTRFDG